MKSTSDAQPPVDDSFADESLTMHHAVPMTSYETRVSTRTGSVPDFIDVTDDITDAVKASGVAHGRATVFASDDSCSIMVNERESGLLSDIKRTMERMAAGDGSRSSAVVGSSSVVLPVIDGKLRLGTWQRVLLVELKQATDRSVDIQIIGET
jgi:secondary thiamine-phosphate synthase enzyme